MTKKNAWFVSPTSDGWRVKRKNAGRASSTHGKKSAAVRAAKRLAKRNNGQVVVQKRNGRFGYERTYGSNPNRRKN